MKNLKTQIETSILKIKIYISQIFCFQGIGEHNLVPKELTVLVLQSIGEVIRAVVEELANQGVVTNNQCRPQHQPCHEDPGLVDSNVLVNKLGDVSHTFNTSVIENCSSTARWSVMWTFP